MLGFAPSLRLGPGLRALGSEELAEQALIVLREALSNVARHAGATRADVTVDVADEEFLTVTVTDNGLGFTATAELAGPFWAGRALGVQNTAQNIVGMATAPVFGWLITALGYPAALLIAAVFPLAGAALTPVAGERRLSVAYPGGGS